MMHPGLAELQDLDREQYAAGYRSRFSGLPDYETAQRCWRCGWENGDTESLESARHKQALAEGREDHFEDTWGKLFDSREEARANRVPFDEERTEPWKEGWIAVDISLGVLAERERG